MSSIRAGSGAGLLWEFGHPYHTVRGYEFLNILRVLASASLQNVSLQLEYWVDEYWVELQASYSKRLQTTGDWPRARKGLIVVVFRILPKEDSTSPARDIIHNASTRPPIRVFSAPGTALCIDGQLCPTTSY